MPYRRFALATWLLFIAAWRGFADGPLVSSPESEGFSAHRLDQLHTALDLVVASGEYAGYIDLVARDGKVIEWHAAGMRDLAAHKPMTPDTIVQIFSMSKLITSVGFMKLVEDGRVKLSDPVEKYLPVLAHRTVFKGGSVDVPQLEPAEHPPTLKELLNHTAGYYYPETWSADPVPRQLMERAKLWEASDLDDFVRRIAPLPLHQQPGTRFRYGIHLDLLGAVIEKVTGQRLDRYLKQTIFDPLGMVDTGFWVPVGKRERLAVLYARANGELKPSSRLLQEPGPDSGLLSGGGGLYSTATDYARFAQMVLNGGSLNGVRILGRKTVELMTTNTLADLADPHPFGQKDLGFGLGVRIVTDLGQSRHLGSPGMFGWDGAATTLYWIDPKERMVSILLTQHIPYNEDDIFATFMNGVYSSLDR